MQRRFYILISLLIVISSIAFAENSGKRYAVLIGINSYSDQALTQLNSARADAKGLAATLAGSWDKIILLTDDLDPAGMSFPNKTSILKTLSLIADYADKNDTIFVFFSGHGIANTTDDYLLPIDVDTDKLKETAIRTTDIVKPFADAGIKNVILAVDACHESIMKDRSLNVVGVTGTRAESSPYKAAMAIYSTKPGWFSYETKDTKEGLFTHYLIQGLSGAASKSSTVTAGDIASWLPFAVANYAIDQGIKQKPFVVVTNPDIDLIVFNTVIAKTAQTPGSSASSGAGTSPITGQTSAREYKIGDRGPGGGFVFYDKGTYSSGWRYMEVSAIDVDTSVFWSYEQNIDFPTGGKIGAGRSNTSQIVSALGEGIYAAWVCQTYAGGGKTDWFLPSRDELIKVFDNLQRNKLVSLSPRGYWSSTQQAGFAVLVGFDTGDSWKSSGNETHAVRAARMF